MLMKLKTPVLVLSALCLWATLACQRRAPLPVPEGHFRLQATTEVSQRSIQSMADSWGIRVQDTVRKPVALRLTLWLPCDAVVRLSSENSLPAHWEGALVDGEVEVRVSDAARDEEGNSAQAVIEMAGLVDYHYRAPKPFPVLLVRKIGQPGTSASLTWSKVELGDLEQDEPFFRLVPVENGVHPFGEQLEIAKFMGKPVVLQVTPLE